MTGKALVEAEVLPCIVLWTAPKPDTRNCVAYIRPLTIRRADRWPKGTESMRVQVDPSLSFVIAAEARECHDEIQAYTTFFFSPIPGRVTHGLQRRLRLHYTPTYAVAALQSLPKLASFSPNTATPFARNSSSPDLRSSHSLAGDPVAPLQQQQAAQPASHAQARPFLPFPSGSALRRPAMRPRSLSDASDSTVVPASLAKERGEREKGQQANGLFFKRPSGKRSASSRSVSPTRLKRQDSSTLVDGESGDEEVALSPRALQTLLVTLQLLSLVPALSGIAYCTYRAAFAPFDETYRERVRTDVDHWSRRIEWLLCALWAALSGFYCHSLARGLTRRWLVYYPLPAAVIRLVRLSTSTISVAALTNAAIVLCVCAIRSHYRLSSGH